ncbi:hypothetical protein DRW03_10765 [Corallococcus sp. H22C18031201]|uniref:hypothetical protein n=1 Tax=Citreicoccus inhibens TaxID=2849499 RepID=UPI000E7462A3|nr:hypothetical protein [Citreicoccus inhibens]MBU8898896.1 hypothetical protein [Citreicoccus inhibens]RJS24080.1 hypothetical protein DRW03_10765 [Corallococcus sp. H22C18031201]
MNRIAPLVVLSFLALACGREGASSELASRSQSVCGTPVVPETVRIMEGLKPTCEGCHAQGARGYFASAEAFQSLLVADARLVKAGNPDDSELVRLLEGRGSGAFKQMPIGEKSYAQLVAEGTARLPVADVRAWIQGLGTQQRDARPNADAPRITRMTGTQVQRALYQQLGLSNADFFIEAFEFGIPMAESRGDDLYPLQSPDMVPAPRQQPTAERYHGLGGGSVMTQTSADRTASPTFALTLTQVSQRWCRLALAKSGNVALFPAGTQRTANPVDVKATLRRWSMHFLGERLTDTQVDALYTRVFVPLATPTDTEPAYVGVCSYFIRHPHWIFY